MAGEGIVFDAGWLRYRGALNYASYTPLFRRFVGQATARNGKLAERQVRREIRAGVPPPNRPLTAAIKGGSKPLTGTPGADLFNSITSTSPSWDVAIVGAKRMGRGGANIAEIVHNGRTIPVTDRMRAMFLVLAWNSARLRAGRPLLNMSNRAFELWQMSRNKDFHRLKASTRAIVIPPRPYLRYAFQDPGLRRSVEGNWREAVNRALAVKAKGG